MNRFSQILLPSVLLMTVSCSMNARQSEDQTPQNATIAKSASPSADADDEATPLQWTTIEQKDSTDAYTVEYAIDYPTSGDEALLSAVRGWINDELTPVSYDESGNSVKGASYTGSLDNGRALVNYYVKKDAASLLSDYNEAKEGLEDVDDPIEIPPYSNQWTIKAADQTDLYQSMTASSYAFLGGAHGMSSFEGVTFSKATGKRLTRVVKANSARQMQTLLMRGVYEYFKQDDPSFTMRDAKGMLQIEGNIIPLPEVEPYLTEKGVMFVYQPYEIACYAAGMVTFCVPYSKIWNYLTPEAKAVLPASYAPQTTTTTAKRPVAKGKRTVRR